MQTANAKTKLISLALALLMVFAVIFPVIFITIKSDHECTGEDCSVCEMLEEAEKMLTQHRLVPTHFSASILFVCYVMTAIPTVTTFVFICRTQIRLKTRLDD